VSTNARYVGPSVVDVLSLAAAAAWRDGNPTITTGHMLAALSRRSTMFKYWVGGHRKALRRMLWQEEVPGSYPDHTGPHQLLNVSQALQEAHWFARRILRKDREVAGPVWGEQTWLAMREALESPDGAVSTLNPAHLLAALLTGDSNQAQRFLYERQINVSDALHSGGVPDQLSLDSPRLESAAFRTASTGLTESDVPTLVHKVLRVRIRQVWRLGPLSCIVGLEARRQAVRTGNRVSGLLHVLAAILELEAQLSSRRRAWRTEFASDNRAGEVLSRWGLQHESVIRHVWFDRNSIPGDVDTARGWSKQWDPPMAQDVTTVLYRAEKLAAGDGRRFAGTVHVLRALLEEPTGSVLAFVANQGINVVGVRNELQ